MPSSGEVGTIHCRQRIALRSFPKTSGLFNTGVTDVTGSVITLGECAKSTSAVDLPCSDLAPMHGRGSDSDNEVLMASCSSDAILSLEEPFGLEGCNMDFGEVFTDLSEYLQDENNVQQMMADIMTEPEVERSDLPDTIHGVKRTVSEAFETTTQPTLSNPDHNDYILKVKKRKLSNETPSASTSSTEEQGETSKDSKYRERRDKNNLASRVSREARKRKFTVMEQQASVLDNENSQLREKILELEQLTTTMKEMLVNRLAPIKGQ